MMNVKIINFFVHISWIVFGIDVVAAVVVIVLSVLYFTNLKYYYRYLCNGLLVLLHWTKVHPKTPIVYNTRLYVSYMNYFWVYSYSRQMCSAHYLQQWYGLVLVPAAGIVLYMDVSTARVSQSRILNNFYKLLFSKLFWSVFEISVISR